MLSPSHLDAFVRNRYRRLHTEAEMPRVPGRIHAIAVPVARLAGAILMEQSDEWAVQPSRTSHPLNTHWETRIGRCP